MWVEDFGIRLVVEKLAVSSNRSVILAIGKNSRTIAANVHPCPHFSQGGNGQDHARLQLGCSCWSGRFSVRNL